MKLNYHPETDSLYIDLAEATSVESREISEGIILDYDALGNLVGIDIDNASHRVQLERLVVSQFPGSIVSPLFDAATSELRRRRADLAAGGSLGDPWRHVLAAMESAGE